MTANVVLTVTTRLLVLAAGLATSVVTARALGPTGRGDYFFVVTLTAAIVQVANLGLHASNTYLVARDRRLLGRLTSNSAWVSAVLGTTLGAAAVGVAALGLFPQTPLRYLLFVPLLAPPTLFFMLGSNLLVGIDAIREYNLVEAGSRALVLLLLGGAALVAARVEGFLLASTVAWLASALALLVLLHRRHALTPAFRRDTFAAGFRFAAKAYVIALLGFLVLRAGVFLLSRLFTIEEVAYFSVATQFADVLGVLPGVVALLIFPRLVRDEVARWRRTLRACAVIAGLLALASGVLALLASPVVRALFGEQFEPAVPIVRWMLPGVVALGVTSVLSQYLAALGMPKSLVAAWAVGLVAVVGAGRLLIPEHGGVGAAAAFSLAGVVLLVLVGALALRHRHDTPAAGAAPDVSAGVAA